MVQRVARWETEKKLSSVLRFSPQHNLALSPLLPARVSMLASPCSYLLAFSELKINEPLRRAGICQQEE
jgi:hypothetical protein